MAPLPRLETERLVLRPFVAGDAPAVERLAGDRRVAESTLTIPYPYPPGGAIGWIESHTTSWDDGTRLTLAIATNESPEEIVGAIGLALFAEHSRGELGYWIGAPMWGRGYATEAARAMISFGFTTLHLHRIQARHFLRNPPSGRVMQKVEMRFEGINRGAFRRFDRFEDVAVYAILASEWNRNGS